MVDHDGTDAQTTIWIQTAQRHDVQLATIVDHIYSTADGTDHNIIVVRQFGQFARIEHINVEFIVVANGKHDRIQFFQLFDIVRRHIAKLYVRSGVPVRTKWNKKRSMEHSIHE